MTNDELAELLVVRLNKLMERQVFARSIELMLLIPNKVIECGLLSLLNALVRGDDEYDGKLNCRIFYSSGTDTPLRFGVTELPRRSKSPATSK